MVVVAIVAMRHSGWCASGNSFAARVAVSMSHEMALMGGCGRSASPGDSGVSAPR